MLLGANKKTGKDRFFYVMYLSGFQYGFLRENLLLVKTGLVPVFFCSGLNTISTTFPPVKKSAGLLYYRKNKGTEVFLVHPGGPYWVNKDTGAWSIPKGEFTPEEDPLEAAKREFQEETGFQPSGIFKPLHPAKQKSGKIIFAWMAEGDFKAEAISSNDFEMEWPPRSGKFEKFPEVDYASWLPLDQARIKIVPGQLPFLDQLERMLDS